MARYIDADAFKAIIKEHSETQRDKEQAYWFGVLIDMQPTANVAPIADTVRKMESLLIDEVFKVARTQMTCDEPNVADREVRAIIKRIAKEMLEGVE